MKSDNVREKYETPTVSTPRSNISRLLKHSSGETGAYKGIIRQLGERKSEGARQSTFK